MTDATVMVVGSSRGLGAHLVKAFQVKGVERILGLSRTPLDDCPILHTLADHPGYSHIVCDITASNAVAAIEQAVRTTTGPLLVVFNASRIDRDVRTDGTIDFDLFREITKVGVDGLINVFQACDRTWRKRSGTMVAISSINAIMPPVVEPRVAYAPTKAYLSMLVRCMAMLYPQSLNFLTVHLGQIQNSPGKGLMPKPSYRAAAKFIASKVMHTRGNRECFFPWPYRFIFPWINAILSDRYYASILRFLGIEAN